MTKKSEMKWCFTKMFSQLILVSVLLQYSLGYSIFEDEFPEGHPAFYHSLNDGVWNKHQKITRGYMVPVPRVGRRQITEEKRQNMIPQPRIGRHLKDELSEVLAQIQNALRKIQYRCPSLLFTPRISSNEEMYYTENNGDVTEEMLSHNFNEDSPAKVAPEDLIYQREESQVTDNEGDSIVKNNGIPKNDIDDHNIGLSVTSNNGDILLTDKAKNSGFDLFEEEKRQGGLIPAARLGRNVILKTLEGSKPVGSLITYPRIDRRFWELHRTLIPYPRAGRYIEDPVSMDYDILMNADYDTSGLEDTLMDSFLSSEPAPHKRALKFIPRIGRKKRSVSEGNEKEEGRTARMDEQEMSPLDNTPYFWDDLETVDPDYFFRSDKKGMRSKSAFIPRVGKKRSDDGNFEEKRAMSFTPRVGRAALIPRIGRIDPRFRLMSRGALVPRVGRRAALTPRVGRSTNNDDQNKESN